MFDLSKIGGCPRCYLSVENAKALLLFSIATEVNLASFKDQKD